MELYFAPLACSMSARIALAEAGAAINLVEVDTQAGRIVATGEDYRAVNPLGYVPALKLDDGTVLTENSAILQYIADHYPEAQLAPPASDRVGRAKLRQWLSFISAELHKGLMTPLLGDKTPPEVKAWTLNKYAPRLAYLDAKLEGPGIPARPLQRRGRLSDHGPELDARDASDRPLRLSQCESLSRAHAGKAERRRGFGDGDSAVPRGSRAAQGGLKRAQGGRGGRYPQSSHCKPGARSNSPRLPVTTVSARLRAWPAIRMSNPPIARPCRSSVPRMSAA